MSETLLKFLDVFFFAFHSLFILFNVFGWLVKKWRRLNLITLTLTALSWFVLGIWYGWGYCLCTDWHWQVRETLGYNDMSNSYVHFLILKVTGKDLPVDLVDTVTVVVFFVVLAVSIFLNLKLWRRKNKQLI